MTTSHFPPSVEKIVTDYLQRLSARLKGMPDFDRQELLNEIRSHIFESYLNEGVDDEIDRILAVLRKLGEPDDVISSRMPKSISRVGQRRKAPLYILAGVLIALFGVPLGLGALGVLIGLLAALLGLVIAYFATAVSLAVAGFVGAVASAITLFAPEVIVSINRLAGTEVVQYGPFNPAVFGLLGLIVSLLISALGLLMLWSARYLWRGFRFVVNLIVTHVRRIFGSRLARGHLGDSLSVPYYAGPSQAQ
jgi:uncharacterized membrane protein